MARLLLLALILAWLVYTVWITVGYLHTQRLMKGLHEPELWLPRRERRAHARKLLAREDDEYTQRLIEKTTRYINQEGPR